MLNHDYELGTNFVLYANLIIAAFLHLPGEKRSVFASPWAFLLLHERGHFSLGDYLAYLHLPGE